MLFKLSTLDSNLTLTLGYLNPALDNLAQDSTSTILYDWTNHAAVQVENLME